MDKKSLKIAAHGITKYRKGDSIEDDELDLAIKYLELTTTFLDMLDERYRLAKFDMILLLDQLKSSKECRLAYDRNKK